MGLGGLRLNDGGEGSYRFHVKISASVKNERQSQQLLKGRCILIVLSVHAIIATLKAHKNFKKQIANYIRSSGPADSCSPPGRFSGYTTVHILLLGMTGIKKAAYINCAECILLKAHQKQITDDISPHIKD